LIFFASEKKISSHNKSLGALYVKVRLLVKQARVDRAVRATSTLIFYPNNYR